MNKSVIYIVVGVILLTGILVLRVNTKVHDPAIEGRLVVVGFYTSTLPGRVVYQIVYDTKTKREYLLNSKGEMLLLPESADR